MLKYPLHCALAGAQLLPNLGAAAVMGMVLAAMVLRPAWYISHRAGLQLLVRILRCVQLIMSHHSVNIFCPDAPALYNVYGLFLYGSCPQ